MSTLIDVLEAAPSANIVDQNASEIILVLDISKQLLEPGPPPHGESAFTCILIDRHDRYLLLRCIFLDALHLVRRRVDLTLHRHPYIGRSVSKRQGNQGFR